MPESLNKINILNISCDVSSLGRKSIYIGVNGIINFKISSNLTVKELIEYIYIHIKVRLI